MIDEQEEKLNNALRLWGETKEMATKLTPEIIAKGMVDDPMYWADLHIFQNDIIDGLAQILDQYRARLELLLREPDEIDH